MLVNQTKSEYFLELWESWRKHFKLPPIETRLDYRYKCHACIEAWDNGRIELVYNPKYLNKWSIPLIISGVLHELGHYKNDLPYDTIEEQIKSEYKAERFAVTIMARYYPKELKEVIKHVKRYNLKNKKWRKKWTIHYQAYLKIKEYNEA